MHGLCIVGLCVYLEIAQSVVGLLWLSANNLSK